MLNYVISGYFLSAESADFVRMINEQFDSCNGNSKYPPGGAKYRCETSDSSPHSQFWADMNEELKKVYACSSNRDEPSKKKEELHLKKVKKKSFCQFYQHRWASKGKKKNWIERTNGLGLGNKYYERLIWQIKESGFDYMMTRRLKKDCQENYFSQMHSLGGHNW